MNIPSKPRILSADESTPAMHCWFVEDNGAGNRGYAAADARRGYLPPDGGGLFPSIEEVRGAMKRQKIRTANILPTFDDEVPGHWKIRSLTTAELEALLKH